MPAVDLVQAYQVLRPVSGPLQIHDNNFRMPGCVQLTSAIYLVVVCAMSPLLGLGGLSVFIGVFKHLLSVYPHTLLELPLALAATVVMGEWARMHTRNVSSACNVLYVPRLVFAHYYSNGGH